MVGLTIASGTLLFLDLDASEQYAIYIFEHYSHCRASILWVMFVVHHHWHI
jgi:hypothetical protein